MDIETAVDGEDASRMHRGLWLLDNVDPSKARFPCCIVWTPLPVISWLVPYFGHVGICREDGTVLDFTGSNFVIIDNFAYGAVARYLQLDREKCCFPPNISHHTCVHGSRHVEQGTSQSWDGALHASTERFQHKYFNLFTCNCHSFVANCLNQLAYGGDVGWNVVNLAAMVLWRGQWVDGVAAFRAFSPSAVVLCLGILMAGWSFVVGMAVFSFLIVGWFVFGTYCVRIVAC